MCLDEITRGEIGKNAIKSNDHGGCRHHTAAMGPHSRRQIIQQSTNMLCDGLHVLCCVLLVTKCKLSEDGRAIDPQDESDDNSPK